MKVAIRTDASHAIGSGHLMRCLALASEMRRSGWSVKFITSGREKKWISLVHQYGFEYVLINTLIDSSLTFRNFDDAITKSVSSNFSMAWRNDVIETKKALRGEIFDWIVVDHYNLDVRWESAVRPCTKRILVIDDLADREHDCEILLDCVYGRTNDDYAKLVPAGCKLLLGTSYALLRPEFSKWRNYALDRRQECDVVKKVLVSLGGVDKENLTGLVLDTLQKVEWDANVMIEVVVGHGFKHKRCIKEQIASIPLRVALDIGVDDMGRRIAEADLGIGGFGISTWERFCLGLPSVNIVTENNQINAIGMLQRELFSGLIYSDSIKTSLTTYIEKISSDKSVYRKLAECCSLLVDGSGLPRTVNEIDFLQKRLGG